MRKVIKVNKVTGVKGYLKIVNGIFNLTPTEIEFLSHLIELDRELSRVGFDVFSAEGRKKISEKMGWSSVMTCNSYIMALKRKKMLRQVGDTYKISPLLVPDEDQAEILIKYA